MNVRYCVPAGALLMLTAVMANAQVPEIINYQGRLVDSGTLVNRMVRMQLRLYSDAQGGAPLYEDSNTVSVVDGLYSTFIGDNTTVGTITGALANGAAFVEVVVDGVVLVPRDRLTSVAYALGGVKGVVGDQGPTGDKGPIGDQGPVGPAGPLAGSNKQLIFNDAGTAAGAGIYYDKLTGNLGIGTANPTNTLAVNGTIKAKGVRVTMNGWADFVFDGDYDLMPLPDVERYVKDNGHLPGVPSAAEVTGGDVDLGEMQRRLMQKIEELTLHVISLEKRLREVEQTEQPRPSQD